MFFVLDVWTKNWISGLPEGESACSLVIIPASAITNTDVKIKEIISNFCRTTKWLGPLPLVHEFRMEYQLGKRKIWDWLLAVWGSPSTCLRELKSSLSFLEARAVNRGLGQPRSQGSLLPSGFGLLGNAGPTQGFYDWSMSKNRSEQNVKNVFEYLRDTPDVGRLCFHITKI